MSETIDAAEICRRYAVGRSTVSAWHTRRKENGFPPGRREGRRTVWDAAAVAEWIGARRAEAQQLRRERATAFAATGAPDDLLTATEAAALLGYSGPAVIHHYRHHRPGYFPEPDERALVPLPGRGRPAEMRWRRSTLVAWLRNGAAPAAERERGAA